MRESGDGALVVVVGGINSDHVVKGERLPAPGESVAGGQFVVSGGGKGANQAVAACRFGCPVALLGSVGDDGRGTELLRVLAGEGVVTGAVARRADEQTGAALVMVDASGEKQIMVAPGANARLGPDDVEAALRGRRDARVLLAQLEVPVAAVRRGLELAKGAGMATVLDPAPAVPLDDELLALVDVIRPNASEARAVTGVEVRDRASARRAAHVLMGRGVSMACVQAGSDGDLLVMRDGELMLPRHRVDVVDATGAGDAFAGVLAAALAEGREPEEAAALGSAAAALATTRLGARDGLPSRDEVLSLAAAPR